MKVEKDGIVKDVAENIVVDYISAGWKAYAEPKKEVKPKKIEKKEEVELEEI